MNWSRAIDAKITRLLHSLGLREAPIPLAPLFETVNARVVFRPLLVDGATATRSDGFTIYCKCEISDISEFQSRLDSKSDGGRTLPPHTRFTLAHEFVHTLFFDLESQPPRNRLVASTELELQKLERMCDEGAAHLLMPDDLLKEDCAQCDLFLPDALLALSRRYAVSLSSMFIRLPNIEVLSSAGALLYLSMSEGNLVVNGAVIHPELCRVIEKPRWKQPVSELGISELALPFRGPGNETCSKVEIAARPANVRFEARSRELAGERFIVTLRRILPE